MVLVKDSTGKREFGHTPIKRKMMSTAPRLRNDASAVSCTLHSSDPLTLRQTTLEDAYSQTDALTMRQARDSGVGFV
jgi:hypothetical protein